MKARCELNKCIRKPAVTCKKCRRSACSVHSKGELCSDCARHRPFF